MELSTATLINLLSVHAQLPRPLWQFLVARLIDRALYAERRHAVLKLIGFPLLPVAFAHHVLSRPRQALVIEVRIIERGLDRSMHPRMTFYRGEPHFPQSVELPR